MAKRKFCSTFLSQESFFNKYLGDCTYLENTTNNKSWNRNKKRKCNNENFGEHLNNYFYSKEYHKSVKDHFSEFNNDFDSNSVKNSSFGDIHVKDYGDQRSQSLGDLSINLNEHLKKPFYSMKDLGNDAINTCRNKKAPKNSMKKMHTLIPSPLLPNKDLSVSILSDFFTNEEEYKSTKISCFRLCDTLNNNIQLVEATGLSQDSYFTGKTNNYNEKHSKYQFTELTYDDKLKEQKRSHSSYFNTDEYKASINNHFSQFSEVMLPGKLSLGNTLINSNLTVKNCNDNTDFKALCKLNQVTGDTFQGSSKNCDNNIEICETVNLGHNSLGFLKTNTLKSECQTHEQLATNSCLKGHAESFTSTDSFQVQCNNDLLFNTQLFFDDTINTSIVQDDCIESVHLRGNKTPNISQVNIVAADTNNQTTKKLFNRQVSKHCNDHSEVIDTCDINVFYSIENVTINKENTTNSISSPLKDKREIFNNNPQQTENLLDVEYLNSTDQLQLDCKNISHSKTLNSITEQTDNTQTILDGSFVFIDLSTPLTQTNPNNPEYLTALGDESPLKLVTYDNMVHNCISDSSFNYAENCDSNISIPKIADPTQRLINIDKQVCWNDTIDTLITDINNIVCELDSKLHVLEQSSIGCQTEISDRIPENIHCSATISNSEDLHAYNSLTPVSYCCTDVNRELGLLGFTNEIESQTDFIGVPSILNSDGIDIHTNIIYNPTNIYTALHDTTHTCMKKKLIKKKIEGTFIDIVKKAVQRQPHFFVVPNQKNWDNSVYEDGCLKLKPPGETLTRKIGLQSRANSNIYKIIIYLLAKCYSFMQTQTNYTKREIYYLIKNYIKSKEKIETAINIISIMFQVEPWYFPIVSSSKGLVFGNLRIIFEENAISCLVSGGLLIPQDIMSIVQFESDASFILVVEKDAVFKKLLEENIFSQFSEQLLIVTGKGFPDINTRLFVRRLEESLKIPIFILVDGDPHGIDIMLTYRFGSMNLSHVSHKLAIQSMKWLGIHPSEMMSLNVDRKKLSELEVRKTENMLNRPYILENGWLKRELEILLENNVKADIEGVMKTNSYLTNFYLPNKFNTKDYF